MSNFPIVDISEQDIDDFEQMGTKSKFWFTDKKDGKEYLFKSTHTEDKQGKPIIRHGENWSEKVSCEIAKLLGVPHANYNLAIHKKENGTVSENFILSGDDLHFGNTLIAHIVKKVFKESLEQGQRSQTISRVHVILKHVIKESPRSWNNTENIKNAYDVFIGYIMLDTLISNQDRHNENWGAIVAKDGKVSLAPSFDHAASLGRNESDEKREGRLNTKLESYSVKAYVNKCKSYFYHENKRLKTIEAFDLFASMSIDAALEWVDRLKNIDRNSVEIILSGIPESIMTNFSKKFCMEIIMENKTRLLESGILLSKNKNLQNLKNEGGL